MPSASQAFERRIEEKVAGAEETTPEEVDEFRLRLIGHDDDGNEVVIREDTFTAARPSDEQLILLYAQGGNSKATVADETAAMFDTFQDILPPNQYRTLMKRFRDKNDKGVDTEIIADIFEWLLEQWQGFPTSQRSASSGSRASSGTKSTGRARGKASIH